MGEEGRESRVQHRVDEHEHGDEKQQTAHQRTLPLRKGAAPADKTRMSRSLGFPLLIISLAVGGFLFVQQSQTAGPTSSVAQQAATQASAAASATDFNAALPDLQAWVADHGTYAGVTLPPVYGITVVRADATSFCLQSGAEHEVGPGGTPEPGPC
jgi:hypothetical protein